jgi:tRNA(Arg) A34 adenosine deaminase TadA
MHSDISVGDVGGLVGRVSTALCALLIQRATDDRGEPAEVSMANVGQTPPTIIAPPVTNTPLPLPDLPTLYESSDLAKYWDGPVSDMVNVDWTSCEIPEDLNTEVGRERHRIYCFLLMKLIRRFWNGNKRGPLGEYPRRKKQELVAGRYRGDMFDPPVPDPLRVNWDRYLGHNIACLAVDGKGEIIDFEFNHNDFFRSSAEHAESRMVRRLFGLTDIRDSWRTGREIPEKSRAFALKDVTLYTSLESCAQCSGVMSLGRVKQVIYLQNDPGAYQVGNIMYNLAGRQADDQTALAAIPVPASLIGLPHYGALNRGYAHFMTDITDAKLKNDQTRAFYIPPSFMPNPRIDYDPSITSFLCTDVALEIFEDGAKYLDPSQVAHPTCQYRSTPGTLTNAQVLAEAMEFFKYADVEGFRGSPHRL